MSSFSPAAPPDVTKESSRYVKRRKHHNLLFNILAFRSRTRVPWGKTCWVEVLLCWFLEYSGMFGTWFLYYAYLRYFLAKTIHCRGKYLAVLYSHRIFWSQCRQLSKRRGLPFTHYPRQGMETAVPWIFRNRTAWTFTRIKQFKFINTKICMS